MTGDLVDSAAVGTEYVLDVPAVWKLEPRGGGGDGGGGGGHHRQLTVAGIIAPAVSRR